MAPAFLYNTNKNLPFGVNGCEANDLKVQLKLIDNITNTLRDDLMTTIKSGSRICIAAANFSIYAFQELREQLNDIAELRFIFTLLSFITKQCTVAPLTQLNLNSGIFRKYPTNCLPI
ncbi:MAG: hypothetical protein K2J70_00025 [Muribaculaceae bacterium]|nr:hypothetical protein [Muribaculaceae bacterium]